jgi:hypothetical protein
MCSSSTKYDASLAQTVGSYAAIPWARASPSATPVNNQNTYTAHIFTNSNSALADKPLIDEWLATASKSADNIRAGGIAGH